MKAFRYTSGLSILLYLVSSPLTGVWHTRSECDGKIVNLEFVESFLFLIIASGTLLFFLILSFFIKPNTFHKYMQVAIIISNTAIVMFDLVVIYCSYQGLITNFNWGNADVILFISAGPLTMMFCVGLFIFIYGYNEMLRQLMHKYE